MEPKQLRTIRRELGVLSSRKAFCTPLTLAERGNLDLLIRRIDLSDSKNIYISDAGFDSIRRIAATIHGADLFGGHVSQQDIYSAIRKSIRECFTQNRWFDDVQAFLKEVRMYIRDQIAKWTFAVPIYGVDLGETDSIQLGSCKIMTSPEPELGANNVDYSKAHLDIAIDGAKRLNWLVGHANGTRIVAEQIFKAHAHHIVGMLAITGAAMYERGATGFRFGIVMEAEDVQGVTTWLGWNDVERRMWSTRSFRTGQLLKLDGRVLENLTQDNNYRQGFLLFEKGNRSELEETIVKATYWFADAQRDPVLVMKLIKFWSCIEAFFATGTQKITQSVCGCFTSVLIYGGFEVLEPADYDKIRATMVSLYAKRSKALHRATYREVTQSDLDDLSQWVAWMLLTMLSLAERGYATLKQVNEQAIRLDKKHKT